MRPQAQFGLPGKLVTFHVSEFNAARVGMMRNRAGAVQRVGRIYCPDGAVNAGERRVIMSVTWMNRASCGGVTPAAA